MRLLEFTPPAEDDVKVELYEAFGGVMSAVGRDRVKGFAVCVLDETGKAHFRQCVAAGPIHDLALADMLTQQREAVLALRFSGQVEEDFPA